ncbi:MAG: TerB family tellurite resistance protein [Pseudolabrys sp.]|nr:TerB family tellurite resistance protein [Pseudolabrys sp.]
MFGAFRKMMAELVEGDRPANDYGENDYRLAAATMLVHTAAIDGNISDSERARLHDVLKQRFNLDDAATDRLVEEATEAESKAIDLYQFTTRLNRSLDDAARARLVEMMWQIVFADGAVTEFEDNLIWRAADLLHVPREQRIALRMRVAEAAKGGNV